MKAKEEESTENSYGGDFLEGHLDDLEDHDSLAGLNSLPDALVAQVAGLLLSFSVLGSLLVAKTADIVAEALFPGQLFLDKLLRLPEYSYSYLV